MQDVFVGGRSSLGRVRRTPEEARLDLRPPGHREARLDPRPPGDGRADNRSQLPARSSGGFVLCRSGVRNGWISSYLSSARHRLTVPIGIGTFRVRPWVCQILTVELASVEQSVSALWYRACQVLTVGLSTDHVSAASERGTDHVAAVS